MYFNRIILPTDTLEIIAEEINLAKPEFILDFHHRHCAAHNVISEKRLVAGQIIHLPDKSTVEKVNAEVQQELSKSELNPNLKFDAKSINGIYQTKIIESNTNSNGKPEKVKITYRVQLQHISSKDNVHVAEYSRTDFRTSHGGLMPDLAQKCFEAVQPILIELNMKGEIIQIGIEKERLNKFKQYKKELSSYYVGEAAADFINEFEQVIGDEKLFNHKMLQDTFMKTFFAPIRSKFSFGKAKVKLPFSDVEEWALTQKLKENAERQMVLSQNYQEEKPFHSNYYFGEYALDAKDHHLESCDVLFGQKWSATEIATKIIIQKTGS